MCWFLVMGRWDGEGLLSRFHCLAGGLRDLDCIVSFVESGKRYPKNVFSWVWKKTAGQRMGGM